MVKGKNTQKTGEGELIEVLVTLIQASNKKRWMTVRRSIGNELHYCRKFLCWKMNNVQVVYI